MLRTLAVVAVAAATLIAGPVAAQTRGQIADLLKTDQGTRIVIATYCSEQVSASRVASCTDRIYITCGDKRSVDAKVQCIVANKPR